MAGLLFEILHPFSNLVRTSQFACYKTLGGQYCDLISAGALVERNGTGRAVLGSINDTHLISNQQSIMLF